MKKKYFLFLILISLLPLRDLILIPGAYKSHDFIEHAARLASFYESLKQGNFIPRWGGNLNYGYGHPVLMFLYPLSNYLGSLIHFLGFNIIDSLKILFILGYVFSGLFMFLWLEELWGAKAGLIGVVFYLFAPYRFVDIYVRAALGEHLAFVFIPLTCWLITKLIKNYQKKYLFFSSLSLAFLILSHNALSLMFLPFILFYSLWLLFYFHKFKKLIKVIFLVFIFGLSLSAFFWLPAFLEGKYTLRDMVTTKEIFLNNSLRWHELFFSKWGYGLSSSKENLSGFMVSLAWFQWLVILISLIILKFQKGLLKIFFITSLFYFFLGIFLTLNFSKILVNYLPLIYRFQFPWRFLAIGVLIPALLAAYLSYFLKLRLILITPLLFLVIFSTVNYWKIQAKEKEYSDEQLLYHYPGTTDTGESTPRWALRFQQSYPEAKVQLVWGKLEEFEIKKWQFEKHEYLVKTTEKSQLVDNTLYFPGWQVLVDGKEVPVNFFDPNWRGLITYSVPAGNHEIVVKFVRTKVRWLGDIMSLFSLISLSLYCLINPKKLIKIINKKK